MIARVPGADIRNLLDRIRHRLPDSPVREVSMFGAIAVMVDDSMVVAVNKDRSLLVRVSPEDDGLLVRRHDASRAEMGAGRSMGIGWLTVDAPAVERDETLDLWLRHALSRLDRQRASGGS